MIYFLCILSFYIPAFQNCFWDIVDIYDHLLNKKIRSSTYWLQYVSFGEIVNN